MNAGKTKSSSTFTRSDIEDDASKICSNSTPLKTAFIVANVCCVVGCFVLELGIK